MVWTQQTQCNTLLDTGNGSAQESTPTQVGCLSPCKVCLHLNVTSIYKLVQSVKTVMSNLKFPMQDKPLLLVNILYIWSDVGTICCTNIGNRYLPDTCCNVFSVWVWLSCDTTFHFRAMVKVQWVILYMNKCLFIISTEGTSPLCCAAMFLQ